jgi:putative membrane protein
MKNNSVRGGFTLIGVAALMIGTVACSSNTANKEAANTAPPAAAPVTPKLSSDDKDFLTSIAKSSYGEIQLAQLALKKAHSKSVQAFAQKMIDDHQKLNGDVAKLASTKGVTLPDSASLAAGFSEGHLKMLSGTHFDQEFLKKMIDDHNDTINAFQKEAANGSDTDVKDFASTKVSELKDHLASAQELENKTNTHKGSKG